MDPRLSTDINRLSTDDLALCIAVLDVLVRKARKRRDEKMVSELSARLSACDRELGLRQLRLDVDHRAGGPAGL